MYLNFLMDVMDRYCTKTVSKQYFKGTLIIQSLQVSREEPYKIFLDFQTNLYLELNLY